jgi:hypothetical protein
MRASRDSTKRKSTDPDDVAADENPAGCGAPSVWLESSDGRVARLAAVPGSDVYSWLNTWSGREGR